MIEAFLRSLVSEDRATLKSDPSAGAKLKAGPGVECQAPGSPLITLDPFGGGTIERIGSVTHRTNVELGLAGDIGAAG